MLRTTWNLSLITLWTATALVACTGEKGTTDTDAESTGKTTGAAETGSSTDTPTETGEPTTSTSTGDDSTTTPTGATTMMEAETAADGESCVANDDCMSKACLKYRDLEAGECVAAADGGNTRIAGTLVDFVKGTPIASTELRVIGALSALSDPDNAPAVVMATSDAQGVVDVTSLAPLSEGIGLVGIITGGDFYTTATGLASPVAGNYGPMNGNRDIWGVPAATLTEWSDFLVTDPDLAKSLPLGKEGGVVGFVRDGTGAAKAGAKVVSATNGDATKAKIRYLAEDGLSFSGDATSANGLFVLVSPALAEKFQVEGGTVQGTAGSAKGAVFVMILTEP